MIGLVTVGSGNWRVRAYTSRFVSPSGDDMGGTNNCSDPGKACKTIQNAVNHSGSGDLIELSGGTYTENVEVNQNVTVQALDPSSPVTVNGNNTGPVFIIDQVDANSNPIAVTISMLTITNGNAGDSAKNEGGGIQNFGALTVIQSTISGNKATSKSSGTPAGGGIFNRGTLTVINSTISGNQATGGNGGGIDLNTSGTTTLVNTTINGNTAASGGGVCIEEGTLNFTNTIVSGSLAGGDCANPFNLGTIGANDRNLVQDGSCSPAVSGNPKLGPLQNNGGPTFTHALLPTSPAIDAGDDSVLGNTYNLTTDQRGNGFPRKACAHVDIGAYEFSSGIPPTINCPVNIATVTDTGKNTATVSFTVTASSDPCNGTALVPSCKIGSTPVTSPAQFPVGVTTVNCSVSDSNGDVATCSFTVTVTGLNTCIQDDHTGDTFRFNSTTGQYVYTRCRDNFTLTGTGVIGNSNGYVTLTDSKPDRRINAGFSLATLTGRANITLISSGFFQTITVYDTNPHPTCTCM